MKTWLVKVGFMGGENKDKELYSKFFIVKAETDEFAESAVFNGLSMQEYHSFKVLGIKEINYEH